MNLIISIIALGFLIFFHELGHFLVAKIFRVKVEVFSIGFGKKLLAYNYKGTIYAISLIPLGGYVKLKGERDEIADEKQKPQSLKSEKQKILEYRKTKRDFFKSDSLDTKHHLARIAILFAGAFFNFLIAFILLLAISFHHIAKPLDRPEVGKVDPSFPSAKVLMPKDLILKVDGKDISHFQDISTILNSNKSLRTADLVIKREDRILNLQVELKEQNSRLLLGVTQAVYYVKPTIKEAFIDAGRLFKTYAYLIVAGLKKMVTNLAGIKEVSGVIGIAELSTKALNQDVLVFINIIALISINLGILNLLPLPMLDGGQIVFNAYEWIFRRSVNALIARVLITLSIVILIALMLIGTLNDITRLVSQ
ncbi:RIP metalloprotease RseP [Helicobacter sp. 11S02629-2]|uniref:RIP metalloprotease RseP n=1 Tax=Helicobacter sp. 11S02629-2 TaxID=1476195 RepID=UPI000BA7D167|nr:RIP metalloprotease RseP [Helicobacter sp. 11S02629-2]PAF45329.1 RIP metalloprotease RseP [Helicobacter sp. 11S02629-2]